VLLTRCELARTPLSGPPNALFIAMAPKWQNCRLSVSATLVKHKSAIGCATSAKTLNETTVVSAPFNI